jgi:drug/metabolite transporter (DMT)-like permease
MSGLSHFRSLRKGIIYTLLAWFCTTGMYITSKFAVEETSLAFVVLFQNVIGLLFFSPFMIRDKESFKTAHFKLIFVRSLSGLSNFLLVPWAEQKISISDAILLNSSAPIFVPFVIWIWKRSPINHKLWPAIFIGFVGIALVLKPTSGILNIGALIGLGAGISLAIVLVSLRLLAQAEKKYYTVIFYFCLISALGCLPFAIIFWKPVMLHTILKLVLAGLLFSMGQLFYIKAFSYGRADALAPFSYSAIIYALFFEWLLWSRYPNWVSILGILLICTGGILTVILSAPPKKSMRD